MIKKILLLLFFIFVVTFFIFFFTNKSSSQKPKNKITVVCTTNMIADALKNIGGNYIEIHCLMGPGIDPHLYRARESDVIKMLDADVIFYNGLHLEGKLAYLFEHIQSYIKTVPVTQLIARNKLRMMEFEDNFDPHIWFDISLWINVIECIRDTLITLDETHQKYYKDQTAAYLFQLKKLHTYVQEKSHSLPLDKRILITAHDAYGYFGAAYGFQVVGLQGISTESEPGIKDIQDSADFIVTHKVRAIFTENSIPIRAIRAVQEAAKARNWHVDIGPELYSDSLGSPNSAQGTYVGMIHYTIDAITSALSH